MSIGIVRVAAVATLIALASASAVIADTPNSITIQMHALNGSGENGTATLEPAGDKVRVTIDVTGEANGASEPAHVHFGRCPNIKAVPAYNVGPVVDGKASAVVDLKWADITSGAYVVNVHQSTEALGKYVSCGDIGNSTAPAPLPTEDSGY
jgi:hypothetical protein